MGAAPRSCSAAIGGQDAQRRDFTINALFASRDGTLHDYVGGRADLEARRVRFIGDPVTRIAEDYLRILRFFRFHASYADGPLDPAGLAACIRARTQIDTLSRERVRMELMKLLIAPAAAPTCEAMMDAGIFGPVLGGVPLVASLRRMAAIEAAAGLAPDACRRLGALGGWYCRRRGAAFTTAAVEQRGSRAVALDGECLVADLTEPMSRRCAPCCIGSASSISAIA